MENVQFYNETLDKTFQGQVTDLLAYFKNKAISWTRPCELFIVTHSLEVEEDGTNYFLIKMNKFDAAEVKIGEPDNEKDKRILVRGHIWESNHKKSIVQLGFDPELWSNPANIWHWNRVFINNNTAQDYAMVLKLVSGSKTKLSFPEKPKFIPERISTLEDRCMHIIGLVGFKGSGKDTVGKILEEEFGFVKDSFAGTLKDITAQLFNWDREMLEGQTAESRATREVLDKWWCKELGRDDWTPRKALQWMGTEVMRTNFHKDIWLLTVRNRIENGGNRRVVITDCRFENEIKMIRKMGGYVIRVKRGPEPEWFNIAHVVNTGKMPDGTIADPVSAKEAMAIFNIHDSETNWIGCDIDIVIENEECEQWLEQLRTKIKEIMDQLEIFHQ